MQARIPSLSGLHPKLSKKLSDLRSYFDGSYTVRLNSCWWEKDDEETIVTTGLSFRLKFLGMKIVRGSRDTKGCMETFRELDGGVRRRHSALMTITPERVHVIQYPWKLACDHAVVMISFCCTDPQNPRIFGYITRDVNSRNHVCVCFKAFEDSGVTGERLVSAFDSAFTYAGDKDEIMQSSAPMVALADKEVANFRYKGLSHYHSKLRQCHTCEHFMRCEDTTGSAAKKLTATGHIPTVSHLKSNLSGTRCTGTLLRQRGMLKPRNYPPPPPPAREMDQTAVRDQISN